MAFKPKRLVDSNVKGITTVPTLRPQLNVHPILDAATGSYYSGLNGEKILSGGMMTITAWVGEGNTFKSTIINSIAMRAMGHHASLSVSSYDTENNFNYARMQNIANNVPELGGIDISDAEGRYSLVASADVPGEVWWNALKELGESKLKDKEQIGTTPFLDTFSKNKNSKGIKIPYPTLNLVDSFTELSTTSDYKLMDENDVDSSKTNTFFMNNSRSKTKMLKEMTATLDNASNFVMMTAHLSEKISIGPTPDRKQLNRIRQGFKIKGTCPNFNFLTHHLWWIDKSTANYRSDRQGVMWPTKDEVEDKEDQLRIIFSGVRIKSGPSGIVQELIVSQSKGVLWDLSCFNYCKTTKFGIEEIGNSNTVDLYPDEVLMRTTVRDKLAANPRLVRALELTTELGIMYQSRNATIPLQYHLPMKEVRQKIIDQGIDFNKLLDTRGYWLFEEEVKELGDQCLPYLSGYDLLRIAAGEFKPHWLVTAKA